MIRILISILASFLLIGCGGDTPPDTSETPKEAPVTEAGPEVRDTERPAGQLIKLGEMASEHVIPREVQVWLPPGYEESGKAYPVLYMHDGQNLFERGFSYTGDEWEVDETMTRLIRGGTIRPAIIVATHNTGPTRWVEYAPQKVVELWPEERLAELQAELDDLLGDRVGEASGLTGDAYLKFLVEELKPRIDEEYRTLTGREDTFVAGSSMGGLISLYALAEYPDVFGGAACISIHWPIGDPGHELAMSSVTAMQTYLAGSRLDPSRQKIWFDRGTETLDAHYGPYAHQMAGWFAARFPSAGEKVTFRTYPGTEHNEKAWAARLRDPLTFLLGVEGEEE